MSSQLGRSFLTVAQLVDLHQGEGRCVDIGGRKIALFRDGDEVFAIDNHCPHEGAPLAEGFCDDGFVVCPLHAWEFDLRTGRVRNGVERVEVFLVRVAVDGSVELEIDQSV